MLTDYEKDVISNAVDILRRGGLVAFPTETVYGLGADATNPAAVARIFQAKGRPATNPLIVHVADEETARKYAAEWPDLARRMAEHFWPGPLTIVVKRGPTIADAVTAGGPTVGLRVPAHPVALELLRAFGGAVAAPSANRSEHVSPTLASHVADDLGDRVDMILDGGACGVGIESTVVDATGGAIRLLRFGGVTVEELEPIVGPVRIEVHGTSGPSASPGQHAKHYAPTTPAFRFSADQRHAVIERANSEGATVLSMPIDPVEYARVLYRRLREIDAEGHAAIYIEMPPENPDWAAVRDRLVRATAALADANSA
jgi:L-threonylcarbamoyladenylate synthase